MCGKLPHVETLSSPDNYSFIFIWTYTEMLTMSILYDREKKVNLAGVFIN